MRGSLRWLQLRVGLLVVFALTVLALAIFFIGRTGVVFGTRYRVVTLMPSASGLAEGAIVRVAGQDVGKVEAIEFIPFAERRRPDEVLRITMALDRRVRDQVRSDSEARLLTQGLLGDKVIDIRPGTLRGRVLEEGDTVPSAAPVDLEELVRSAADALGTTVELLSDVRAIADALLRGEGTAGLVLTDDRLYASLLEASESLTTFLAALNRGSGALGRLAQDSALYVDLRSAVAALDSVAGALAAGEGTLGRLLWSDTLYARLLGASVRADSLLRRLETGEGTAGKLVRDPDLYENLNKIVVDLQAILEEFRTNPRKYLPPVRVF
jgi:phospholipid/cholesterol/gamma-HCH transport system substrate-binding protein